MLIFLPTEFLIQPAVPSTDCCPCVQHILWTLMIMVIGHIISDVVCYPPKQYSGLLPLMVSRSYEMLNQGCMICSQGIRSLYKKEPVTVAFIQKQFGAIHLDDSFARKFQVEFTCYMQYNITCLIT